MGNSRLYLLPIPIIIMFASCEEVIQVDLNTSDPAFVVEAFIYKDSVSQVRLTKTASYFSIEEPALIEDAVITISDGILSEVLSYAGSGYYAGEKILGSEGKNYEIKINHEEITYKGESRMPAKASILSISYSKNNTQTIFNPTGKTMYVITCNFIDNPDIDNYYMIRYILDGHVLGGSFYVMNETSAVNGTFEIYNKNIADNDTIKFEEWMFYDGGTAEVQVLSIDKYVYDYFVQLNDILFWKRRIYPPAPYNPTSNIDNGALGYFAAWSFDSKKIMLE